MSVVLHIFPFLVLARHRRDAASVSQAQLRQTNRSEQVLKIAKRRNGDFSPTTGATLTR